MDAITRLAHEAAMVKVGSTALTRRIAKGVLSPQTIQRAAAAMPKGKFRFIRNLGRGQFNLADEVVGNVGGHAGRMVRKIPTQALPSAGHEFQSINNTVNQLNRRYGRTWYGAKRPSPPIAPYHHVGDQGAFQDLATGTVTLPWGLKRKLRDLHSGNVGPRGQVLDFGLRRRSGISGSTPTPHDEMWRHPRIDQGATVGGKDLLGNVPEASPLQQYLPYSNNMIRRYWGLKPGQRPEFRAQLNDDLARRSVELQRDHFGYMDLLKRQLQNASTVPFVPQGMPTWKKRALMGGTGLGAAGGGYGLYSAFANK